MADIVLAIEDLTASPPVKSEQDERGGERACIFHPTTKKTDGRKHEKKTTRIACNQKSLDERPSKRNVSPINIINQTVKGGTAMDPANQIKRGEPERPYMQGMTAIIQSTEVNRIT